MEIIATARLFFKCIHVYYTEYHILYVQPAYIVACLSLHTCFAHQPVSLASSSLPVIVSDTVLTHNRGVIYTPTHRLTSSYTARRMGIRTPYALAYIVTCVRLQTYCNCTEKRRCKLEDARARQCEFVAPAVNLPHAKAMGPGCIHKGIHIHSVLGQCL